MGLGAARKRVKLSHDPNNTTWSRATTNFGHQQLLGQGWTPGSNLGASNAPYAQFHTKASASHIRVSQTAENLGLGAAHGSGHLAGQYTGLDVFQSLLGRLNGKSETELEKEQKARDDLKTTIYAERKWGGLRFVSGGLLAGTRQENLEQAEVPDVISVDGQTRLAALTSTITVSDVQDTSSREEDDTQPIDNIAKRPTTRSTEQSEHDSIAGLGSSKAQRKAEKAQRRLDRKKRREAKKARREARHTEQPQLPEDSAPKADSTTEAVCVSREILIGGSSLPPLEAPPSIPKSNVLQVSQASLQGGRHAIRHRHIQQKKMAFLDPKALNEILMIKA